MTNQSLEAVKAQMLELVARAADGEHPPEMHHRLWSAIWLCGTENGDPAEIVEWVIETLRQSGHLRD